MSSFANGFWGFFRFLKWTLYIAIVIFGIKYCSDARARYQADKFPDEWWTKVSNYPNGDYTAKSTLVGGGVILLRLYRTGDPTLLAERTYTKHGVALRWTKDMLIYDTSEDFYLGGGIQLPPTRIDRLLAKLP